MSHASCVLVTSLMLPPSQSACTHVSSLPVMIVLYVTGHTVIVLSLCILTFGDAEGFGQELHKATPSHTFVLIIAPHPQAFDDFQTFSFFSGSYTAYTYYVRTYNDKN